MKTTAGIYLVKTLSKQMDQMMKKHKELAEQLNSIKNPKKFAVEIEDILGESASLYDAYKLRQEMINEAVRLEGFLK